MAKQQAATVEAPKAPSILCKFQCTNVQDLATGDDYQERISLSATTGENPDGSKNVNESFSLLTPYGVMQFIVTNPNAKGFFTSGKDYYIEISEAPVLVDPIS